MDLLSDERRSFGVIAQINPLDPASLTTPVIAQWGAYGVILILALVAIYKLATALVKSFSDRLADQKEMLLATLKNSADATQALRDMKTTVDAVINMMKARP